MINLLPPDDKRQLVAARTNSLLLRYSVLLAILIGILALEIIGMMFVVDLGKSQNETTTRENEAKTAGYDAVRRKSEAFRSNLSIANNILGRQVPYTTLIFALANNLPAGAIVNTLSLDPATFGKPTSITVNTTSYQKAIEVKNSLQQAKINGSTLLFTSVSFQSVAVSESISSYPYTAVYNVTYSKAALIK